MNLGEHYSGLHNLINSLLRRYFKLSVYIVNM